MQYWAGKKGRVTAKYKCKRYLKEVKQHAKYYKCLLSNFIMCFDENNVEAI